MIVNPPHPVIYCDKLSCYLNPKWCDVRSTKTNEYGEIACPECHECRIGDDVSLQCIKHKRATNKYNKRRSIAIDSAILEKARENGFNTVISFLLELHKTQTFREIAQMFGLSYYAVNTRWHKGGNGEN